MTNIPNTTSDTPRRLPRLLFVTCGRWSNSAVSLREAARESGDVDLDVRDIGPRLLGGVLTKVRALPHALRRSGLGALRKGTGLFKEGVKATPWYVGQMRRALEEINGQGRYDAALVIGTMVPAYVLDCPYFIYTDLPILGNQTLPGGEERVRFWSECLPLERRAMQQARRVFTMSEFARRAACECYGLADANVRCVYAGCNSPIPLGDAGKHGNGHGRNILFVGVDWDRKGGPELLEAFRQVRRRVPDASLTIVGCRPSVAGESGVNVVGRVPPERLGEHYQRAAVFCMPSRREPFGIVYIEAMQAAVPAICSDCGAAPEMVRHGVTGFCVPPGDVGALAGRLEELLCDPRRRSEMGRAGQKLVQEEFTWTRTWQRIWESMTAAAGPGTNGRAT